MVEFESMLSEFQDAQGEDLGRIARQYASGLVEASDEPFISPSGFSLVPDLYETVGQFRHLSAVCSIAGREIPCAVIEESPPLPFNFLSRVMPEPFLPDHVGLLDYLQRIELAPQVLEGMGFESEWLSSGEASEAFHEHLWRFIHARLVGFREPDAFRDATRVAIVPPPGDSASQLTLGLNFSVHTQSEGLKVYYSKAAVLDPQYFGQPSTPVEGLIGTGVFLFGAAKVGALPQFDRTTKYTIPPHTEAHLAY